ARSLPSAQLAADRALQQQLLGVRAGGEEAASEEPGPGKAAAGGTARPGAARSVNGVASGANDESGDADEAPLRVFTVLRADGPGEPLPAGAGAERSVRGLTRWNAAAPGAAPADRPLLSQTPARKNEALEKPSRRPDDDPPGVLDEASRGARVLE